MVTRPEGIERARASTRCAFAVAKSVAPAAIPGSCRTCPKATDRASCGISQPAGRHFTRIAR